MPLSHQITQKAILGLPYSLVEFRVFVFWWLISILIVTLKIPVLSSSDYLILQGLAQVVEVVGVARHPHN